MNGSRSSMTTTWRCWWKTRLRAASRATSIKLLAEKPQPRPPRDAKPRDVRNAAQDPKQPARATAVRRPRPVAVHGAGVALARGGPRVRVLPVHVRVAQPACGETAVAVRVRAARLPA